MSEEGFGEVRLRLEDFELGLGVDQTLQCVS